MMGLVVRSTRWRVAVGLVIAALLALSLPEALAHRMWLATASGTVLVPWLVLGRERTRRRQGWRDAAAAAAGRRRLALAELAGPALVVLVAAAGAARGHWAASLALATWGWALLGFADALDRRWDAPGAAWLGCVFGAGVIWSAPWWLARWFGRTSLAPHLATDAVGFHPVGVSLAAADLPTLQDPWFYQWTLSGVVEALPTPWSHGVLLYSILAAVAAGLAVRAAGRIDSRRMT